MNRPLIVKKCVALSMSMMLTLGLLLSTVGPAMAQENSGAPGRNVPAAPSQQGPTDPAELEAFLDGFFAEAMEEYHIAGAAIAVVRDGELFLAEIVDASARGRPACIRARAAIC